MGRASECSDSKESGSVWSGRACGKSAVPAATVKLQARADRSLWLSVVPTATRSGCARSPLGELSLSVITLCDSLPRVRHFDIECE